MPDGCKSTVFLFMNAPGLGNLRENTHHDDIRERLTKYVISTVVLLFNG